MNRRDFLHVAGQGGMVTWLASFWGNRQGRKAVEAVKSDKPKTNEDLDREHRLRREVHENQQLSSTVTATALGLGVTSCVLGRDINSIGFEQGVNAELSAVPSDERPALLRDLTSLTEGHDRRAFLSQLGGAALVGGTVGPAITYFSGSGERIAEEVHGKVKEGESTVTTQHRAITTARQNLLSTLENTGLVSGVMVTPRILPEDTSLMHAKCETIGKHKISQLLVDGETKISFTADSIMSGENLLSMFPDSLKIPDTQLNITTNISREGPDTILQIARYDQNDNTFRLVNQTGTGLDKGKPIVLKAGMKVNIEVMKLG